MGGPSLRAPSVARFRRSLHGAARPRATLGTSRVFLDCRHLGPVVPGRHLGAGSRCRRLARDGSRPPRLPNGTRTRERPGSMLHRSASGLQSTPGSAGRRRRSPPPGGLRPRRRKSWVWPDQTHAGTASSAPTVPPKGRPPAPAHSKSTAVWNHPSRSGTCRWERRIEGRCRADQPCEQLGGRPYAPHRGQPLAGRRFPPLAVAFSALRIGDPE
jgi:hypothetical protein